MSKAKVCNISSISKDIDQHLHTIDIIMDNCQVKGAYVDGGVALMSSSLES